MSMIPDEQLKSNEKIQLAPMVDFLFLILALLAVVAISRAFLYDTEINLAKLSSENKSYNEFTTTQSRRDCIVNFSITKEGKYKLMTERGESFLENTIAVKNELLKLCEQGIIASDRNLVKVLLHIDKQAPWGNIADAIFAIRESGFSTHPVYTENR